jgi:hypothetical protein
LPAAFQQERQNFEWLARQANRDSVPEKLPIPKVRLKRPESKDWRGL